MDQFTFDHLNAWVENNIPNKQTEVFDAMCAFIREYPDVVERGDSWPEILRLVNRKNFLINGSGPSHNEEIMRD